MNRKGFIKVTTFDEKVRLEERKPIGTSLINVNEIAFIVCHENGSAIILKDYATQIYVFEAEKELQMKINAAKEDIMMEG